jgi:hypothetical protein
LGNDVMLVKMMKLQPGIQEMQHLKHVEEK